METMCSMKRAGANAIITYFAFEIAKNLNSSSQKCIAYKSDASKLDQCENLVESFLNDFETIDVLINNAGITKDNLLMRMGEDDFDKVMEVNLKSVFNMTKACQRVFLKNRKGSIINMSSVVGVKGNAGQSNYAASKAGIIGFSKSIAQELGSRSIRCNVIAPGFIKTEMTDKINEEFKNNLINKIPSGNLGTGHDVSNCVAFLASDMANYINGETIHVNGGMYMA